MLKVLRTAVGPAIKNQSCQALLFNFLSYIYVSKYKDTRGKTT